MDDLIEVEVAVDVNPEVKKDAPNLSASQLEYLDQCPSYRSYFSNNAADEGAFMHKCCELLERLNPQLNEEQKLQVGKALDYAFSVLPNGWTKEKVFVSPYTQRRSILDVYFKERFKATVMDYKFGRNPVTPIEDNMQLLSYAAILFKKYKRLKEVHLHIIQPRLDFVDFMVVTKDMMPQIEFRLNKIILEATMEEKRYRPGAVCAYCDVKNMCPALMEKAIACAKEYDLPVPKEWNPEKMVTIEDRNAAQWMATILPDWCAAVKKANTEAVLEEGIELPDFSLIRNAGGRSILDILTIYEILKEEGVSLVEFLNCCTLAVTKLDAVIQNVAVLKGKPVDVVSTELQDKMLDACALQIGEGYYYLKKKARKKVKELING